MENEMNLDQLLQMMKDLKRDLYASFGELQHRVEELEEQRRFQHIPNKQYGIPTPKPPSEVPKGYALTGEYRVPKKGEWYKRQVINQAMKVESNDDFNVPKWILVKQPPEAPEGFEFTGEYRAPKKNEIFFVNITSHWAMATGDWEADEKRWILKLIPKSKRWVFEETGEVRELFRDEFGLDRVGGILKQNGAYYNKFQVVKLVEKPDAS